MPELRRATILFSQGQPADSIYFLESGLVKLTRTNSEGGRIILAIRGAFDLVGEEALVSGSALANSEAEVIQSGSAYRIPKTVVQSEVEAHSQLASWLLNCLGETRNAFAEKIELLCLHDVEYRVLYYLAQLGTLVSRAADGNGSYQIPVTQLELADLIGATRETTSTVLNQLERRGLVRLSRRMLTIESPETVQAALNRSEKGVSGPHGSSTVASDATV